MERTILSRLLDWKDSESRKPLILNGARQVGKTWSIREFGSNHFSYFHEFNFETDETLSAVFDRDLNPDRILKELSFIAGRSIVPGNLIFFDEIQACGRALTSLKYFNEKKKNYHICAAGSLLGVRYGQEDSYPVGMVHNEYLFPMSFREFCQALGEQRFLDMFASFGNEGALAGPDHIPDSIHTEVWELYKEYMVTGGLPEVVAQYLDNRHDPAKACKVARDIQAELIHNYLNDMAKHSGKVKAMHIERVFRNLPSQLALEKSRYMFKDVIPGNKGYQALAGPIDWLEGAGLVLKTSIANKAEIPLAAFTKENVFKLYAFDIGILGALADIPPAAILKYDYGQFKGYFAENLTACSFAAAGFKRLVSWAEKTAEVEFLLQLGGNVIPIEVKAGINTKAKSLDVFLQKYHPPCMFVFCGQNHKSKAGNRIHLPLYMTEFINRLID